MSAAPPTDIGLLESWRVVDPVARYRDDLSLALTTLDNDQLLLGRRTSEHDLRVVVENLVDLSGRHVAQVRAVDHACLCIATNTNHQSCYILELQSFKNSKNSNNKNWIEHIQQSKLFFGKPITGMDRPLKS